MRTGLTPARTAVLLAALAGALTLAAAAGGRPAPPRGCPSFGSQADAQAYFVHLGGSPRHPVGRLDADRDGVACEQLDGPYAGFATIGYNRTKGFLWGAAAMPTDNDTEAVGDFACLLGNTHFPEGPRLVRVMRAVPGPDRQVYRSIGAEVRSQTGHLVWKANRRLTAPGRYYAEFEERVRLHPYGPNECPGFRTRVVELPGGHS